MTRRQIPEDYTADELDEWRDEAWREWVAFQSDGAREINETARQERQHRSSEQW